MYVRLLSVGLFYGVFLCDFKILCALGQIERRFPFSFCHFYWLQSFLTIFVRSKFVRFGVCAFFVLHFRCCYFIFMHINTSISTSNRNNNCKWYNNCNRSTNNHEMCIHSSTFRMSICMRVCMCVCVCIPNFVVHSMLESYFCYRQLHSTEQQQ